MSTTNDESDDQKMPAITSYKRPRNNHNGTADDLATVEEENILNSLGTARALTSNYESDLLRQATHKLAPSLTFTKIKGDPDATEIGFPDLISGTALLPFSASMTRGQAGQMGHKTARSNNRLVILQVLHRIQNQMNQLETSTDPTTIDTLRLLAMKEHILLNMLGGSSQQSRKLSTQKAWQNEMNCEEIYRVAEKIQQQQSAARGNKRISMMQRKQIPAATAAVPGSSSLAKAAEQLSRINGRKKLNWKDWSSDDEEEEQDYTEEDEVSPMLVEMNYSRRSNQGRSQQQKRSTQPTKNTPAKRRPTVRNGRRRVHPSNSTIRRPGDTRGGISVTMTHAQEPLPRKRRRTPAVSYTEAINDDSNDDEEENEFDYTPQRNLGGTDDNDAIQSTDVGGSNGAAVKQEQSEDHETLANTQTETSIQIKSEPDNFDAEVSNVTCPLCQVTWTIADPCEMDAELSRHMAECQTHERRSRRNRTPRSYNEEEPLEDPQSAATQQSQKRKRQVKYMADDDDESLVENNIENFDDEDEQLFLDNDIDSEDEEDEMLLNGDVLEKPTAVDDYRLDDYEDRVDYWKLHGVEEMRDMSHLRVEGETNPGAITLQGGLTVPAWMNNRLFAYQRTGLEWMWTLHQQQAGGVMGDEMGLGKTVQVAGYLGAMAASRKLKGVLIISPATMLQHWLSELAIWAPGLRRVLIHSSGDTNGSSSLDLPTRNLNKQAYAIFNNLRKWLKQARADHINEAIPDHDVEGTFEGSDSFCGTGYAVITTYEHVRRNQEIYVSHPWSYIVMDEAQKIRNPQADVTLAVKRLRTPHRIAMTGTPIQNDLKELWSLFDFCFPGRLGTLPAFEQEFAEVIKRGGYSNASPVQVQLAYRMSLTLRDLIDPYLLRRQKSEIEEMKRMPSKTEHVLFCRLSKRQRRMYEAFLASDVVRRIFKGSSLLFAAITMLRKICNHPDLVLPNSSDDVLEAYLRNGCVPEEGLDSDEEDEEDYVFDPDNARKDDLASRAGKFEVLSRILPLWKKQGHRVLIFCQWTKMLTIIQHYVTMQGWKFARLDGKTNVASRQRIVDTFNNDDSYFGMLCTTRTGGVGLNLTGANRIILYDVDWNPQTDAQARERAWRFGQEKQVTVYRLCTAGTIEEKMYQRQIFKTALTNKVLHDPRQRRLFSHKDLHDLLTLQPDSGKAGSGGDEVIETTDRLATASKRRDGKDGFVSTSDVSQDDGETLKSVLRSKGLAGVFDHHFVDPSASGGKKSTSVRFMEEEAKRIAKEAAKALEASVDNQPGGEDGDLFTPTWTGGDRESRFGGNRSRLVPPSKGSDTSYAGARRAGVRTGDDNSKSKSSGSLLASLRQRNEEVKTGGRSQHDSSTGPSKDSKYAKLLLRIRDYVRQNDPTTEQVLEAFATSFSSDEAAIFKRLLNSVARLTDGKWTIRPQS